MDNKKWSKRFSTIFWWVLAFLPLFSAIFAMIGYNFAHLNSIDNITSISDYFTSENNSISYFLDVQFKSNVGFSWFIPSFISNLFSDLFDLIIPEGFGSFAQWSDLFAWSTWIFIVHLIFDIIIWLPCFLHDLIDRFRK